jgi:hypothetical protein
LGYFSGTESANFFKDLLGDIFDIKRLRIENFREVSEVEFLDIFELICIFFLELFNEE